MKLKDNKKGLIMKVGAAVLGVIILAGAVLNKKPVYANKNMVMFTEPKEVYSTQAEYDFYYNNKLQELVEKEGIVIDEEKPLSAQYIKKDLSIDDYLKTYALDSIRHNHAILSYIESNNLKIMTEEELKNEFDNYIDDLESEHETLSKKQKMSFQEFLQNKFGEATTEENLKYVYEKDVLVNEFVRELKERERSDVNLNQIKDDDMFKAKRYMYYDIHFTNLEEKEKAEEEAFEIFDLVLNEDTFLSSIKAVDENLQKEIERDGLEDEDIEEMYTETMTIADNKNSTHQWLFNHNEKGEIPIPGSSAILSTTTGIEGEEGFYRVIYLIENLNDYSSALWDYDKIVISQEIEGSMEAAEEEAVRVLTQIEEIETRNSDEYDEIIKGIIKDHSHETDGMFREEKENDIVEKVGQEYVDFLKSSEEFDHKTFENEDGYIIIINRGFKTLSYDEELVDYLQELKVNAVLGDIYRYSEDFKLVADDNKVPYLDMNMDMYKANSIVETLLENYYEKEELEEAEKEENESTEEDLEEDTSEEINDEENGEGDDDVVEEGEKDTPVESGEGNDTSVESSTNEESDSEGDTDEGSIGYEEEGNEGE